MLELSHSHPFTHCLRLLSRCHAGRVAVTDCAAPKAENISYLALHRTSLLNAGLEEDVVRLPGRSWTGQGYQGDNIELRLT